MSDVGAPSSAPLRTPGNGPDMAWIPSGEFLMGSSDFYPEESPLHRVGVDGFWIDVHPVTVAEFRRFVKATGYVTVAERPLVPEQYPDADPDLLVPGSLVFHPTAGPVDPDDYRNWWSTSRAPSGGTLKGPGARSTGGTGTPSRTWRTRRRRPRSLGRQGPPNRGRMGVCGAGGLEGAVFAWGDEFMPKGKVMANTWHGQFPWQRERATGWSARARRLGPSEWVRARRRDRQRIGVDELFSPRHPNEPAHASCTPVNPRVESPDQSYGAGMPGADIPRRVTKGGSHLWHQLLPPVPPGRPAGRSRGHLDEPHRVPLRHPTPKQPLTPNVPAEGYRSLGSRVNAQSLDELDLARPPSLGDESASAQVWAGVA